MYNKITLINTKYLIIGVDNKIEFDIIKFSVGFFIELPFIFIHIFWK
jgi:hypothetical protein